MWKTILVVGALAAFACGGPSGDDDDSASGEATSVSKQLPRDKLEKLYTWDASKGAKGDVEADSKACDTSVGAPTEASESAMLVRMSKLIKCMAAKGWDFTP